MGLYFHNCAGCNWNTLTEDDLKRYGIDSEEKRGSYLIARILGRLFHRTTICIKKKGNNAFIDFRGGFIIPYEWDRKSSERKKKIKRSLDKATNGKQLIQAIIPLTRAYICFKDIKTYQKKMIQRFKRFSKINKDKLRLVKFEYVLHKVKGTLMCYGHCHVFVHATSADDFANNWSRFASKRQQPKLRGKCSAVEPDINLGLEPMTSYMAKHPLSLVINERRYPLYEKEAREALADADWTVMYKATNRARFLWFPRD
jgi:hypothetical protein